MSASVKRIYLIGLMGAGKTTVGKILAAILEWQFIDMDQKIETLTGKNIPEIFESEGEASFRTYESQILETTLELNQAIIACGGGVVTKSKNIQILANETTIWLDLSPAEAAAHLEHSKNRPLLNKSEDTLMQLNEILNSRREAYGNSARIKINSGGLSPEIIVSDILKKIEAVNA